MFINTPRTVSRYFRILTRFQLEKEPQIETKLLNCYILEILGAGWFRWVHGQTFQGIIKSERGECWTGSVSAHGQISSSLEEFDFSLKCSHFEYSIIKSQTPAFYNIMQNSYQCSAKQCMQTACMFSSLPFLAIITPVLTDFKCINVYIYKNWRFSWNQNNEFTATATALNISSRHLRSDKVFIEIFQSVGWHCQV